MSTRTDLLKLLSDNTGSFVSGQKIGDALKVSRNAIWKAIEQLRSEGYEIDSKPRVGYCLKSDTNILSRDSVACYLKYPCDLRIFDSVDSTNNVAKEIALEPAPGDSASAASGGAKPTGLTHGGFGDSASAASGGAKPTDLTHCDSTSAASGGAKPTDLTHCDSTSAASGGAKPTDLTHGGSASAASGGAKPTDLTHGGFGDSASAASGGAKPTAVFPKPIAIIADKQTGGRGRLGRSFESPAGSGIYLSLALKPKFDLAKSLNVTMATAVAVCHAIEKVIPARPKIKWVNDIFVDGKKICGILTEAQSNFETGEIDSLVIGIGVNCFPGNIPPELSEIVGHLSDDFGSFSRSMLAAEIINETLSAVENLQSGDFLTEYRSRCFILGKDITVFPAVGAPGVKARAIDIDSHGGLVVEYMEGRLSRQMETLTAGEVSVKI